MATGGAQALANLAHGLRDLFFAPACAACGGAVEHDEFLCPACREQVSPPTEPSCRVCGLPGHSWHCPACAASPPAFDAARALALHTGPLAEVVRGFKYQRRYWLGEGLSRLLGTAPRSWWATADIVAPVPLHPRRLVARGFNQALVLARGLPGGQGPELAPRLLNRKRYTRPQVGLDPGARRRNVEGAFALAPAWQGRLEGAWVLLVDDVFTTGATVNECAKVLKQAGAERVEVLTLVRAVGGKS
ncbi:MAG: ComF family protein [Proteobacteria bacterium]|nr:ComF family protein [Pseudomonadota bacterium]MBU4383534.1 ComF family protein [Pseudomonadota bacterium]MBU4605976.1 ComF family protein [Pseudomonadota bacterium]MCG2764459.1 ComF family protein [Desulfarculaceae bacterium]